jgi:hypothetical protein
MCKISEGVRTLSTGHYRYSLSEESRTSIIRKIAEKHHTHSPTEEPRISVINRLKLKL